MRSIDLEDQVDDTISPDIDDTGSTKISYRSRQSAYRRSSIEDPLLPRRSLSFGSSNNEWKSKDRIKQEIHIASEDSTLVITGFRTATTGAVLYFFLCTVTLGFAFLIFRWLPRWRIKLLGKYSSLSQCQWAVVEVSTI